ncbi:hypothetical protein AA313_de0207562 [Arthrobotrys entomopaga]|nr:hypothetical protein AA313_de0207562 [Arthrobotrys entomopaga]
MAAVISEADFLSYNPALARGCNNVKDRWGYCVHITGPTPIIPTVQTTTLRTITTSKPSSSSSPTPYRLGPSHSDQFPPKSGQATQCVPEPAGKPRPWTVVNGDLKRGINAACDQMIGSGSKWLEKGYRYTGVAKVLEQVVYYELEIWLGGFSVPRDTCVKQLRAAVDTCHFGNGATYGGCAYTDDGNLQACFFPSLGFHL